MNLLQSGPAPKIQSFGKEELNLILKFGAQDLFKVNLSFGQFSSDIYVDSETNIVP